MDAELTREMQKSFSGDQKWKYNPTNYFQQRVLKYEPNRTASCDEENIKHRENSSVPSKLQLDFKATSIGSSSKKIVKTN